MKLLLDTHCWLWLQTNPERLGRRILDVLADRETDLLLSAASSWEIAIKHALGRLPLPLPPAEYVPDRMRSSGIDGLAVEHRHALHVATLPLLHRDPFDRLLIAQAQIERVAIVSTDPQIRRYDVEILAPT